MAFPLNDPRVEHLVVLMMENRSFDHMIGLLKDEIDDLRGVAAGDYSNPDTVGTDVPLTDDAKYQGQLKSDPGHDFNDVYLQMYGTPFNGTLARTPTMTGFVKSYEQQTGVSTGAAVMKCFKQITAFITLNSCLSQLP